MSGWWKEWIPWPVGVLESRAGNQRDRLAAAIERHRSTPLGGSPKVGDRTRRDTRLWEVLDEVTGELVEEQHRDRGGL